MSLEDIQDFLCPYCGEANTLSIDFSGGNSQRFVLDCEVCCAPIVIRLKIRGDQVLSFEVLRENE